MAKVTRLVNTLIEGDQGRLGQPSLSAPLKPQAPSSKIAEPAEAAEAAKSAEAAPPNDTSSGAGESENNG